MAVADRLDGGAVRRLGHAGAATAVGWYARESGAPTLMAAVGGYVQLGTRRCVRVSAYSRIHGLLSDESRVLAYGGREANVLRTEDLSVVQKVGPTRCWILAAALTEGGFVLGFADNSIAEFCDAKCVWHAQGPTTSFALYAMDIKIDGGALDVATGSAFGDVAVWSLAFDRTDEAPIERARWRAHAGSVMRVRWRDDGKSTVATASDDRTACLWDVSTASVRVRLLGFDARVWDCQPLADDGIAACGEDGSCRVGWADGAAIETEGCTLAPLPCHSGYSGAWRIAVDERTGLVATAGADGGAKLWPLPSRGEQAPMVPSAGKTRARTLRNAKKNAKKRGAPAAPACDHADAGAPPRLGDGGAATPAVVSGQLFTTFRWRAPLPPDGASSREFVRSVAFDASRARILAGSQHGAVFAVACGHNNTWSADRIRAADGARVMALVCVKSLVLVALDEGTVEAWRPDDDTLAYAWRAADAPEADSADGEGRGRLVDFMLTNGGTASAEATVRACASSADGWAVSWSVETSGASRAGAGYLAKGNICTAAAHLPRWLVAGNAIGDIFVFAAREDDARWRCAHKLDGAHALEVTRLAPSTANADSVVSYGVDGRVLVWTIDHSGDTPPRITRETAVAMHVFGTEAAYGMFPTDDAAHERMVGFVRDVFDVVDMQTAMVERSAVAGNYKRAWAYDASMKSFACYDTRADELLIAHWDDGAGAPRSEAQPLACSGDGWETNGVALLDDRVMLASEGGNVASIVLPDAKCEGRASSILREHRWGRVSSKASATAVAAERVADGSWYVVAVGSHGTIAAWNAKSQSQAERLAVWDDTLASALSPEATLRHLSVAVLPPHGARADDAGWRIAVGASDGAVRLFAAPRPDGGGAPPRFVRLADLRRGGSSAGGVPWGVASAACLEGRAHAVVAASTDGALMAWRVADGAGDADGAPCLEVPRVHRGAALSASAVELRDGIAAAATGGDDERGVVVLLRVPTALARPPELLARVELVSHGLGGIAHAGAVRGISVVSDAAGGAVVASAGLDACVRVWRVQCGTEWTGAPLACIRTDVVETNACAVHRVGGCVCRVVVAGKGVEVFAFDL